MFVFRVALVAAALALAGISGGFAQTAAMQPSPEALRAAKDLIALISPGTLEKMTLAMISGMWPTIEANLRAQHPKIDVETLAELRGESERFVIGIVTDTMKDDAPAIYARYFTATEMDEIAAFYRTPTGAKALTVTPKAMADIGPVVQARIGPTGAKLEAAFNSILKKRGYQPR